MHIQKALELAQAFKRSITDDHPWDLCQHGGYANRTNYSVPLSSDSSKQFVLLLLNTFLDMHDSLSKSLEGERKELQDAYNKYGEPFVLALQKSAEEHAHNFVEQWEKQHRDSLVEETKEEDAHIINFGPTNQEKTPVDDDPEELEEGIPQIVINIGELNINLNGGV